MLVYSDNIYGDSGKEALDNLINNLIDSKHMESNYSQIEYEA